MEKTTDKSAWSIAPQAFPVTACIPPWIEWQRSARHGTPAPSREIRAGINFSIVLGAACFVEGSLESTLLRQIPHDDGQPPLARRLLADLRTKVSATTGSDRWDNLFDLVTGEKASVLVGDNSLWESMKVLFHFRNMIAHARAVSYDLLFPPGVGGYWDEEFSGGYKTISFASR